MNADLPADALRAIWRARIRFDPESDQPRISLRGAGAFAWEGESEARRHLGESLMLDRRQARSAAALLAELVADAIGNQS